MYVFGKILRGPKLTKLSPNKTYAGMIGGYLLSIISTIFLINLNLIQELPIKWFIFVILILNRNNSLSVDEQFVFW